MNRLEAVRGASIAAFVDSVNERFADFVDFYSMLMILIFLYK